MKPWFVPDCENMYLSLCYCNVWQMHGVHRTWWYRKLSWGSLWKQSATSETILLFSKMGGKFLWLVLVAYLFYIQNSEKSPGMQPYSTVGMGCEWLSDILISFLLFIVMASIFVSIHLKSQCIYQIYEYLDLQWSYYMYIFIRSLLKSLWILHLLSS